MSSCTNWKQTSKIFKSNSLFLKNRATLFDEIVMHMSDALLSPVVGIGMWAVSGGALALACRRLRDEEETIRADRTALLGIMGSFVFAAQMINIAIPGTGSSGHIGGGLLLAALIGPWAAFVAISSILVLQCLFFADGGLLALGCNIFNIGIIPCLIACPLIYKAIVSDSGKRQTRLYTACICAALFASQLGALNVVILTCASGISALPFATFSLFMLPMHIPTGLFEGLLTAVIISFVSKIRPALFTRPHIDSLPLLSMRAMLLWAVALSLPLGYIAANYASVAPDGLEWSILKAGSDQLAAETSRPGWLPDYFHSNASGVNLNGIIGCLLSFILITCIGFGLRKSKRQE
jgi:cobalt/nickel transport system permease protein